MFMQHLLRLTLLVLISIQVHAFSAAQIQQAKAAVAANPSLLNTSQAKQLMQQQGISGKNSVDMSRKELTVKNSVDLGDTSTTGSDDNDVLRKKLKNKNEVRTRLRLNPLEYKTNDQKLWEIKSAQSTIKRGNLKRFALTFFRNKNKINPNRIVAPADYIINKGDIITFWIYGATNKQEKLEVDARGNINIPQVGPVHVAGEKFQEVKELLTNYLASSYKNSQVVVDLNSFSTAQVTVTGFVKAPGIYNTTSVSSVKDVLIQAGGISDVGSVRKIEVRRNGRLIETIDYYHLLTLGRDHGDTVLQSGDVIHIPRAYGLIAIDGEVNTPAIYEIEPGETLAHILQFAGGLKAAASGKKIYVKRYNRHRNVEYQTLTLSQARRFVTHDGDEVYIGKLNKIDERYIDVQGNVVDAGKKHIGSHKIRLSTFLKQQLKGGKRNTFFLENTQFDYAVIKRVEDDLTPKIYHVNLENVLNGTEDFTLKNKDILYIFNKLDTAVNPYVEITQAMSAKEQREGKTEAPKLLMQEGKFQYTEGMTLRDLINMAGVQSAFDTTRVKVVSYDNTHKKARVKIVNYDKDPDFQLAPFDQVVLFDYFEVNPMKTATIAGEVVKPGTYPISEAMTLAEFIKSAGGLNEKAYPKTCEIIRYYVKNGERKKKIINLDLSKISTFIVQAHDEINIKRIPYWYDKKYITLKGEFRFPGTYVIHNGEKLSSVIERAGGFTDDAFLYGAVFSRKEIAKLQKKSLQRSLSKLKEQVILASLRASGSKTMGQISITEGIQAVQSLIEEAEKLTPIGRISINLTSDIDSLKYSRSDLTLKDGDVLYVPSCNDTVVVSGEVMNPMALTYLGSSVRDYIRKTGGLTEIADSDHIYVLHANGEAEKASIGSYLFSSNNVEVKAGDVIIVPKKIMFERGIDIASDIADIVYKLTLTVAAMHTVGAI
jgi:protein involved in polysaccharide export with SLBB domain